jgi:menaquinone-9 beta-reductase
VKYDVVIVGAGPSGLAVAAALGGLGVSTLVCESANLPVDKACGEGILPSGIADLERLGVPATRARESGQPLAGVRYVATSGRVAESRFAEGPGVGLRRVVLSELLLERVAQLPSVTVVQGARARLRRKPNERGEVRRFAVQVEGALLEPRLIVGADGLNSQVRRQARIATAILPPARWGVRRHLALRPWTDHVEVYWARGCEAYVTPVASDCVNVAYLFERGVVASTTEGQLFDALASHFPQLSRRLSTAMPLGKTRGSGPMHQWPARPVARGLVLTGDAAGYVDALTGEGVGLALRQALVLADVMGPLLARDSEALISAHDLMKAVQRQRRASRGQRRLTKLLLELKGRPDLLERTVAALAADPALFRYCLSLNQGTASLASLPLGSALGLGRQLLGAGRVAGSGEWKGSRGALRHTP